MQVDYSSKMLSQNPQKALGADAHTAEIPGALADLARSLEDLHVCLDRLRDKIDPTINAAMKEKRDE